MKPHRVLERRYYFWMLSWHQTGHQILTPLYINCVSTADTKNTRSCVPDVLLSSIPGPRSIYHSLSLSLSFLYIALSSIYLLLYIFMLCYISISLLHPTFSNLSIYLSWSLFEFSTRCWDTVISLFTITLSLQPPLCYRINGLTLYAGERFTKGISPLWRYTGRWGIRLLIIPAGKVCPFFKTMNMMIMTKK